MLQEEFMFASITALVTILRNLKLPEQYECSKAKNSLKGKIGVAAHLVEQKTNLTKMKQQQQQQQQQNNNNNKNNNYMVWYN